ncbi:preprotein translocase subunit SecE [Candidatus Saccharibacteria bacterium]|nr:preprotein translocase subunit SecE [Candidatus Saccharibacteria bacterium]
MAKITRIKAKDPQKPKSEKKKPEPVVKDASKEITKKDVQLVKETNKKLEKIEKRKERKEKKKNKKTFILFVPFVALGRYLKNSWLELRQVRWPSRKATWKMVLAIFVYTFIFAGFLVLLDILFDFIFSKLLG